MNILFLSPNFPAYNCRFAEQLMLRGVNVLSVGDGVYDSFSLALKGVMTEYYRVESLEDYDAVYRAAAYFTHKYGRIDKVVSMNGYWQTLEAALRTDYAMDGPKRATPLQTADFDVTFEALVDGTGTPVLSMSRVFSGADGSYTLSEINPEVTEQGEKSITALGTKNAFITVELKKTTAGYRVVNAYNAPAPFATDIMDYAFDFDAYSAWAHMVTGGAQEKMPQNHCIAMVQVMDGREYPGVNAEYFGQLESKMVQESPAAEAFVNADGNTVYVLRGGDEQDARGMLSAFVGRELEKFEKPAKKEASKPASAKKPAAKPAVKPAATKAAAPKTVQKLDTPKTAAEKPVKVTVLDTKTTAAAESKKSTVKSGTSSLLDSSLAPEKKKRGRKPATEKAAAAAESGKTEAKAVKK